MLQLQKFFTSNDLHYTIAEMAATQVAGIKNLLSFNIIFYQSTDPTSSFNPRNTRFS